MPNGNLYQNMGGGSVFVAGPYPNYFGKTYGGIGPGQLSVEPANSKAGALNMRNTYQAAHPAWEQTYKASNTAGVFLTWKEVVNGIETVQLLGQQLILDATDGQYVWMDAASATGVQGPAGIELVNFNEISDNQIPVLFHLPGDNQGKQVARDSGFSLIDNSLVSMHEIAINNADGLTMGVTRVAPLGNDIVLVNDTSGEAASIVSVKFDAQGSAKPGYTMFGQYQSWNFPNDASAVSAGNPLRFRLWHPVSATINGLAVKIPSDVDSVEVPGCAFRLRLNDANSGIIIYDSYLASGGETFTMPANTGPDPLDYSLLMVGAFSVPAMQTVFCEVFSTKEFEELVIRLAGQIMMTPDGEMFVPAITASGFETSWQAIGGGSGGVQSVTGDTVDNTDPANPVVVAPRYRDGKGILFEANGTGDCRISNTGVVSLVAGQGMQVVPNPDDPTEVTLASTGVVEVVAGSGVTVDSSDPARPVVNAAGLQSVRPGPGIAINQIDPLNPIIIALAGRVVVAGDGIEVDTTTVEGECKVINAGVRSLQTGPGIEIDTTDPRRPKISAPGASRSAAVATLWVDTNPGPVPAVSGQVGLTWTESGDHLAAMGLSIDAGKGNIVNNSASAVTLLVSTSMRIDAQAQDTKTVALTVGTSGVGAGVMVEPMKTSTTALRQGLNLWTGTGLIVLAPGGSFSANLWNYSGYPINLEITPFNFTWMQITKLG
jgi:hypothetical protein